jgi:hypothetical protein
MNGIEPNMQQLAPIVLFVYNRYEHTKRIVESILQNTLAKNSELIVFSDGPKNNVDLVEIEKIRHYLNTIKGFKRINIISAETNKGLATSIISGVSDVLTKYPKAIVLEDDIVISHSCLEYFNNALDYYCNNDKVWHISGYLPEKSDLKSELPNSFFLRYMSCWGWATWQRAWQLANWDTNDLIKKVVQNKRKNKKFTLNHLVNLDKQLLWNAEGKINTWAVKWAANIFLNNGLCLYPGNSQTSNIGFDGTGIHCGHDKIGRYSSELDHNFIWKPLDIITESKRGKIYFMSFYSFNKSPKTSLITQLKIFINEYIKRLNN